MNIAELMVIGIVALIVIGPKKLPEVASALGKFIKACRNVSANLKAELENQIKQSQLEENQQRAAEVDEKYQQTRNSYDKE